MAGGGWAGINGKMRTATESGALGEMKVPRPKSRITMETNIQNKKKKKKPTQKIRGSLCRFCASFAGARRRHFSRQLILEPP